MKNTYSTTISQSAVINDGTFFQNNVCKKAGVYFFCLGVYGSAVTNNSQYARVAVEINDAYHPIGSSCSFGYPGVANGSAVLSFVKKLNVGDVVKITEQSTHPECSTIKAVIKIV